MSQEIETVIFGKDIGLIQVGIDLWRLWLANQNVEPHWMSD